MAGTVRKQGSAVAVLERLAQEPAAFGFYEAMRELECYYADRPRFGSSSRPKDDGIRFGQTVSMQFAPSTVSEFIPAGNPGQILKVHFFGLFGANGPLPLHLTEYVRNRIRDAKDGTFADFADLFHHRLLGLFFRAWADKEPVVQLDRPDKDRFSLYVGSLLGLGDASCRQRDALPDYTKLHFAAHLGCHSKHTEGLVAMLRDFFRVPVAIQEFVGEWLAIPKENYCYLAANASAGQLGVSSVIGSRSWQCQHKFRIRLGALTLPEYESFLPCGERLKYVSAIVDNYVGYEFNWDVNLIIKKTAVPPVALGNNGRLGWTSWLHAGARQQDANDLTLSIGKTE